MSEQIDPRLYDFLPPRFTVVVVALPQLVIGNGGEVDFYTVPGGCLAMIQTCFFNFSCDATVGTRQIGCEWRPSSAQSGTYAHIFETVTNANNYTASTSREIVMAVEWPINYTLATGSSMSQVQLPAIWMPEGCVFGLGAGGTGGAADQILFGQLTVRIMPAPVDFLPPLRNLGTPLGRS